MCNWTKKWKMKRNETNPNVAAQATATATTGGRNTTKMIRNLFATEYFRILKWYPTISASCVCVCESVCVHAFFCSARKFVNALPTLFTPFRLNISSFHIWSFQSSKSVGLIIILHLLCELLCVVLRCRFVVLKLIVGVIAAAAAATVVGDDSHSYSFV